MILFCFSCMKDEHRMVNQSQSFPHYFRLRQKFSSMKNYLMEMKRYNNQLKDLCNVCFPIEAFSKDLL